MPAVAKRVSNCSIASPHRLLHLMRSDLDEPLCRESAYGLSWGLPRLLRPMYFKELMFLPDEVFLHAYIKYILQQLLGTAVRETSAGNALEMQSI